MSINAWIKKMRTYIQGNIIHRKRMKECPFAATGMDLDMVTLSEVRQRKTNII